MSTRPQVKGDKTPPTPPSLEEVAGKMLAELGLPEKSDPGFTAWELADVWGIAHSTAKGRILQLKRAGKIIEGTRITKDTTGRRQYTPVYLLKEDAHKEAKQ